MSVMIAVKQQNKLIMNFEGCSEYTLSMLSKVSRRPGKFEYRNKNAAKFLLLTPLYIDSFFHLD